MTYQDKPKQLMADRIVTIENGTVTAVIPVPWLNEEAADIAIFTERKDRMFRWWGIKIIGSTSPWGAFHAVEQWCSQFDDVRELHMIHSNVYNFGRF